MTDLKQSHEVTSLIYETSVNYDAWDPLIQSVSQLAQWSAEYDSRPGDLTDEEGAKLNAMMQHLLQASAISEQMLTYKEAGKFLEQSLFHLAHGLAFFDDNGRVIWANAEMARLEETSRDATAITDVTLSEPNTGDQRSITSWVQIHKNSDVALYLTTDADKGGPELLLLPRQEIEKYGFPVRAACALIKVDPARSDVVGSFSEKFGLTRRESDLVAKLIIGRDLKSAATEIGVTHETARGYLKHVFDKSGCTNQVELTSRVLSMPTVLLRNIGADRRKSDVRQMFTLSSGRQMEVFLLGPAKGTPVLVLQSEIDAMLNLVDDYEHIGDILRRLNIRIFSPQWPGTYRSGTASDAYEGEQFADDTIEIADHIGVKKFAIYALAYATNNALLLAKRQPDRISKVVIGSAYNSDVSDETVKSAEAMFRLTNFLATKVPRVGKSIISLLWRQGLQDTGKMARTFAKTAVCPADVKTLSDPALIDATSRVLHRRLAQGFEGQVQLSMSRYVKRKFKLATIRTPVELFNCDQQMLTPLAGAKQLADDLPNCDLYVLKGVGHYHTRQHWPWQIARAAGQPKEIGSILAEVQRKVQ